MSLTDMTDKMFIFPQETATAHVKLSPKQDNFTAVTVCHRTFTDLKRDHVLFSLATPDNPNGFLTWGFYNDLSLSTYVHNNQVNFPGVDYSPNKWHSICTTWDSATGLTQMWLDGQPLTIKYTTEKPLTGKSIVTLGQDQDSQGGGFDVKQSFVGMMTDVHMWDYVLLPHEIHKFMKGQSFTPGNVLNWAALDCEINGRVVTGAKQTVCFN
uniref:Pentraxin family member n=1 Tax=Neogobius melanostomus TaxID=47308 RepID=A0A8C6V149_9GOBI